MQPFNFRGRRCYILLMYFLKQILLLPNFMEKNKLHIERCKINII